MNNKKVIYSASCQISINHVRYRLISFKWSQAQVYLFQWFISNMLCFCHYGPALLWFWFQTDLGRKISASFLKYRRGRPLLPWSRVGHALRPIFILCSLLKLVYFDSWSWQSFVSTSDVFNCLFPLDVQNEIQLLSRVFCYSWLVCLLGFGWEMRRLSKFGNSISDGIVFVFHLA